MAGSGPRREKSDREGQNQLTDGEACDYVLNAVLVANGSMEVERSGDR